jgi:ABC-type nitrate/sulfonate/bicarbonate transport system permease component
MITPEATLQVMHYNVNQYFKRKPMKDFEYLASSVTPSTTEYVISILIGVLVAFGLGLVFHLYDPFGDAKGTTKYSKSFRVG